MSELVCLAQCPCFTSLALVVTHPRVHTETQEGSAHPGPALGLDPVLRQIDITLLLPHLVVLAIPPLESHSFGLTLSHEGHADVSGKNCPTERFQLSVQQERGHPIFNLRGKVGVDGKRARGQVHGSGGVVGEPRCHRGRTGRR